MRFELRSMGGSVEKLVELVTVILFSMREKRTAAWVSSLFAALNV